MARELSLKIGPLHYAARSHGPRQGMPVLALHGWLDNAASFDVLGKLLPGLRIVAPDLAGHGLSDHRPAPGAYHIWDDLPDLQRIADTLGWERFALLGHSRGGIIATLLAAAIPDRITHLALLDGFWPAGTPPRETAPQLRRYLHDSLRMGRKIAPPYPNQAAAAAARRKAMPISDQAAKRILPRALRRVSGGVRWRSDPMLRAASAFKLSPTHVRAILRAIESPTLLLMASQGLGAYPYLHAELERCHNKNIRWETFPGSHYFHMEEPAPQLAQRLLRFLGSG